MGEKCKWIIIGFAVVVLAGFPCSLYGEEKVKEVQVEDKGPTPQAKQEKKVEDTALKEEKKRKDPKKADSDTPVTIEADHIEYYKDTDTYEAWGSVKITQDGTHMESDYAILDNSSGDALATGNVWYEEADSILIADEVEMNVNTKLGVIYKGRIFQRPDNYHIEGDEMEKVGEDVYEIRSGSFTTCDALVPPWRFRGKDVRVQLNDNIVGRDVVFYIKDVPCLYTPYIKVPIKKDRQTGFLLPRIGYSNQNGFILQNAFYWVMADNMDSTYYLDYRGKIGFGGGIEYRYILNKDARGELYNYYMKDKEVGQDYWVLRYNHDHQITKRLQGKANIYYLSEPAYYQRFSTVTEERVQRALESNFLLSQNWQTSRLYILNQYRQDLTQSNAGTLQKLPEAGYVLTNYKVGKLPLYFTHETTAINFWRKEGMTGQRLNIYPQLSSALNLGSGFVLSPRAGFRERAYLVDGDITDKGIYDLGASIGTKIFRIFEVDGLGGMSKVKHSIEPSISYTYIPEVNQYNLPQFDGIDFIQQTNKVTYSLTNRLIGKLEDEKRKRIYEFVTLKLSQDYDFDKGDEPLSDITMEAMFRTTEFLKFNTGATYNPYSGYMTSFNTTLTLRGDTPWYFSIDERYTKIPEALFLTAEGSVRLFKSLDLSGKVWYDATQKKFLEVDLRGTYTSQCWAVTLLYIGRPEETQILLSVDLKGLGSMKLASFSMEGYERLNP